MSFVEKEFRSTHLKDLPVALGITSGKISNIISHHEIDSKAGSTVDAMVFPAARRPMHLTAADIAALDTTDIAALDTADNAALDTTDNAALDTTDIAALDTTDNAALDTADIAALDTTDNAALDTTDIAALDTADNAALDTTDNAALDTADNAALDTTDNAALDTTDNAALDTADNAALDTADNAALDTTDNAALDTTDNAALIAVEDRVRNGDEGAANSMADTAIGALTVNADTCVDTAMDAAMRMVLDTTVEAKVNTEEATDIYASTPADSGVDPSAYSAAALTPFRIDEIRKGLRSKRKELTLWRYPFRTLCHFSTTVSRFLSFLIRMVVSHPITYSIGIPTLLLLHISNLMEGPHQYFTEELWMYIKLIVWWVGLGILSSVGLGTGMHTGLLFLFPHIFLICSTSESCNSLHFDARVNMWQNVRKPWENFECLTENSTDMLDTYVTLWSLFLKTFPYGFLWGMGSAIGELPPYAASYAAALARRNDEEFEEIQAEIRSKKGGLVNRMTVWTMKLVEDYGSVSVLLLSAWPNVFFDLCGIVCGHFLMPFWSFFSALALGKGIIKICVQCCFFIFLFSSRYDQIRIRALMDIAQFWPINVWVIKRYESVDHLENEILRQIQHLRAGLSGGSIRKQEFLSLGTLFAAITIIALLFFVISCINQFAQMRQKELDEAALDLFIKSNGTVKGHLHLEAFKSAHTRQN